MKFPYGISDFKKIVTQGFYYCDRTDRIPLLEQGHYLLFLRPRRFGKSLLLSMLGNYYDLALRDQFGLLFGSLKIGQQPTPLHNHYFILKWDFSCVDPAGGVQHIKRALYNHINGCIEDFVLAYRDFLPDKVAIDREDALYSMKSLTAVVRQTGHPVYLLIDEYDNFANEVMMGTHQGKAVYEALVFEEGLLKTLFKAIKSSTSDSIFDRIFITGVSPIVMSDLTSGYNIAENIYLDEAYNDLCGFTEPEIADVLEQLAAETEHTLDTTTAMTLMRAYYNSYQFAVESGDAIYNPTLALYFFKHVQQKGKFPRKMLDANLSADEAKLRYIADIPGGKPLLSELNNERHEVVILELSDRFGLERMLDHHSKDQRFLASFLYYFGILTLNGETDEGDLRLTVPNLVIRKLYVERLQEMLLPDPEERDSGILAAKQVYTTGDLSPLADFIERHYFTVFRNPDYKWANELTVKTLFLSLLYNDTLYIMDSEPEIERRFPDLTMIIRPDMRRFNIFDVLIEFKYVKLGDLKLSADSIRKTNLALLQQNPFLQQQMTQAQRQTRDYGNALQRKYAGSLHLKGFAVVAIGFERLWWEPVRFISGEFPNSEGPASRRG